VPVSDAPPSSNHPVRILIVEDDRALADALRSVLMDEGHEVDTAPDTATALEKALRKRPSVVLFDYSMPFANGPSLVTMLRDAFDPPPVFVAISGLLRAKDWCAANGVPIFLRKPFGATTLRHALSNAVEMVVLDVMRAERGDRTTPVPKESIVLVVSSLADERDIDGLLPPEMRDAQVVLVASVASAEHMLSKFVPDLVIVDNAPEFDSVLDKAMKRQIAILVRGSSATRIAKSSPKDEDNGNTGSL